MIEWAWLGLMMLAQEPTPPAMPPAVALSLDVAEAVGARVQKLAVSVDTTVSDDERSEIESALGHTSLFILCTVAEATATLSLTRVNPDIMLATVTAADGDRLWVRRALWPQRAVAPAIPATDRDALYRTVLTYKRNRLRIVPVSQASIPPPIYVEPVRFWAVGDPMPWNVGFGGAVPVSNAPNDWRIVRGAAEVVDELDLARLLDDPRLAGRIEEERFWPQLYWATGFGIGAAAGIGSGLWLHTAKDRDTKAIGISLITMGAVSAVLALMFPAAGPTHVLSPAETQIRVDDYNEALRAELKLDAADLARLAPGE